MAIKESELIIVGNTIYHLGISSDDLGDIVITVGDPKRVERVSRHFDNVSVMKAKREFICHTGTLGNKKISVMGTGIGPDNIDIMLTEVDAARNIDFDQRIIHEKLKKIYFVRMGTCGTIQPDIPVDSLIASSHGFGIDGLMNFYKYDKDRFQVDFLNDLRRDLPEIFDVCMPYIFEGSHFLMNNIGHDMVKGITVTAGGFYGPQGRELRIPQKMRTIIDEMVEYRYRDSLRFTNFEMETSALYGLSRLLNHEALSVNTVIANRAQGTFSKDPYKAIDEMIEQVLERIEGVDI